MVLRGRPHLPRVFEKTEKFDFFEKQNASRVWSACPVEERGYTHDELTRPLQTTQLPYLGPLYGGVPKTFRYGLQSVPRSGNKKRKTSVLSLDFETLSKDISTRSLMSSIIMMTDEIVAALHEPSGLDTCISIEFVQLKRGAPLVRHDLAAACAGMCSGYVAIAFYPEVKTVDPAYLVVEDPTGCQFDGRALQISDEASKGVRLFFSGSLPG